MPPAIYADFSRDRHSLSKSASSPVKKWARGMLACHWWDPRSSPHVKCFLREAVVMASRSQVQPAGFPRAVWSAVVLSLVNSVPLEMNEGLLS